MDKHTILVVDDNHINRLFFQSALKKMNFEVSLADNGYQAIELCHNNNFDVILMDIRMDGLDGIQTVAKIKKIKQHQHTPIVAISAETFVHQKYDDFEGSILKPITQKALKNYLMKLLSSKIAMVFNHNTAMAVSHQDSEIVDKLRNMLQKQLFHDWQDIQNHYQTQQWDLLHERLHNTLGAARVCAAEQLIKGIVELQKFTNQKLSNDDAFEKLKTAVELTIKFENIHDF